MRVIQAVSDGRFTTRQLAQALPDVPPATLYRQLAQLVGGGLLAVVATRRIRGAVERTYAVPAPVRAGPEELASFSHDDHRQLFGAFAGMLLADHRRYMDQPDADPVHAVAFRQMTLALSGIEADALNTAIDALIRAAGTRAPETTAPDRRPRLVTVIMMPAALAETAPAGRDPGVAWATPARTNAGPTVEGCKGAGENQP